MEPVSRTKLRKPMALAQLRTKTHIQGVLVEFMPGCPVDMRRPVEKLMRLSIPDKATQWLPTLFR